MFTNLGQIRCMGAFFVSKVSTRLSISSDFSILCKHSRCQLKTIANDSKQSNFSTVCQLNSNSNDINDNFVSLLKLKLNADVMEADSFVRSLRLLCEVKKVDAKQLLSVENAANLIEFYQQHFDNNIIMANERLFLNDASRSKIMREMYNECGITQLHPLHFIQFDTIVTQPIQYLKDARFLDENFDVMAKYCSMVTQLPSYAKRRLIEDESINNESNSIIEMRNAVLNEYFLFKFGFPIPCFLMIHRTLSDFMSLFDEVGEIIGSANDVVRSKWRYILKIDTAVLREYKRRFPSISGVDVYYVLKNSPSILYSTRKELQEKINFLVNDCKIPHDRVTCKLLEIDVETLKTRVEYWTSLYGKDLFTKYPPSTKLLVDHKKARTVADRSLTTGYETIPVELLFEMCFPKIKLFYSGNFMHYLATNLDVDWKLIRAKLKGHRMRSSADYANTKKIYEFLRDKNFSNEDIFNSVYIVLYDFETVVNVFESIESSSEEMKQWTGHRLFLDYVVYQIEEKIKLDS